MKKEQDFSWINAGIIKKSALAKKIWGVSNSTTTSRLVYRQKNPSSWKTWELERLEQIAKEIERQLIQDIDMDIRLNLEGHGTVAFNAPALPLPAKATKFIVMKAVASSTGATTFHLMNVDEDLRACRADWVQATFPDTHEACLFLIRALDERIVVHVSVG